MDSERNKYREYQNNEQKRLLKRRDIIMIRMLPRMGTLAKTAAFGYSADTSVTSLGRMACATTTGAGRSQGSAPTNYSLPTMSRIDSLTGKRANVGNSRSHSNVATKRKQEVNLQLVRIGGVRVRVSARTIKTLKKLAAEAHGERPSKSKRKQRKLPPALRRKQCKKRKHTKHQKTLRIFPECFLMLSKTSLRRFLDYRVRFLRSIDQLHYRNITFVHVVVLF